MFCDLFLLWPIKRDITAGKRHKGELVLGQELFQFCGLEICDGIRTKLDPGKSGCGNIVDRLALIFAPGYGSVAKANAVCAIGRSERGQGRHGRGRPNTSKKGTSGEM